MDRSKPESASGRSYQHAGVAICPAPTTYQRARHLIPVVRKSSRCLLPHTAEREASADRIIVMSTDRHRLCEELLPGILIFFHDVANQVVLWLICYIRVYICVHNSIVLFEGIFPTSRMFQVLVFRFLCWDLVPSAYHYCALAGTCPGTPSRLVADHPELEDIWC